MQANRIVRSRSSLEIEILAIRHPLNTAAQVTEAADPRQDRSFGIRWPIRLGSRRAERLCGCQTRDRDPLVPGGFSVVLAMEVAATRRPSEGGFGSEAVDPDISVANPMDV